MRLLLVTRARVDSRSRRRSERKSALAGKESNAGLVAAGRWRPPPERPIVEHMFVPVETPASLERLNDEQARAASHLGGPLLILAGAGTGKTTTLCARVAWLVEQGVAPERILLLTFTRRAAREMLARTRALVARDASS